MGRLTDTAASRIKRNNDSTMPDWVPMLGAAALVLLIGWALVGAFIGGDDTAAVAPPAPAVPQGRPGGNSTGGGATTTSTAVPAGNTVELPDVDGDLISVPTAAADLASAVAIGRVRGDVSKIALVDGAEAPSVTATGDRPQITELSIGEAADARIAFVVTVDPDGAGPAGDTYFSVVAVDAGGWRWDPAA